MKRERLEFIIEGALSEEYLVRLTDLIDSLDKVKDALTQIDSSFTGSGKPSVYYRVVELSHSSPPRIVLDSVPIHENADYGNETFNEFVTTWGSLSAGRKPKRVDSQIIEKYKDIASIVNGNVKAIRFRLKRRKVRITHDTQSTIDQYITPDVSEHGDLKGEVLAINLHATPYFRIYPMLGATSVKCTFPDGLMQKVMKALGRNVRVSGELIYKGGETYASEMRVEDVSILKPDKSLPRLMDLRGIAPNATGGIVSEKFIRKLRDEEW